MSVSNPKVFEFAKEIGMTPLALMDKIREWNLPVKSHMAELSPETLAALKEKVGGKKSSDDAKKKTAGKTATAKTASKAAAPKATAKAKAAPAPVVKAGAKKVIKKDAPETAKASLEAKPTVVRRKAGAVPLPPPEKVEETLEEENLPVEASVEVEAAVESQPEQAAPAAKFTEAPEVIVPAAAPAVSVPAAPVVAAAPVAAAAAPAPVAVEVKSAPTPSRKKEVTVGTSGVSSGLTARKNIVGRMDLSRVQGPSRPPGPGGYRGPGGPRTGGGPGGPRTNTGGPQSNFGGPPRPGGQRTNLRAGFVAQSIPLPQDDFESEESIKRKALEKKAKRLEGPASTREKEEVVEDFNAVEFRKRELVFQPKKKKGTLFREAKKTQITTSKASKRILKVIGQMKVSDVAHEIGVKGAQLIKALVLNGVTANLNTSLDFDTIALIIPEFKWEAQNVQRSAEEVLTEEAFGELDVARITRPPVVTIMGHVDHGKTSLLDVIRKTNVASGEAGGITQHIGAYSVKLENGVQITFLDTPGHEAFTAMRARGANATDIAVIVVAADDGMMPQTMEAVNHAKAAKVPIIVAINKMDKPGANPEKIKQQLTELELVPEEWGGTTIYVPVSAMKKTGIKELLEQIQLVAEMQDLKANPQRSGTGIVIESKIAKGRGPVATLLVKDGTVKLGQLVVAGRVRGRVKSLTNEKGEQLKEVLPGFPAEVLGLSETPDAGDQFDVVENEEVAERVLHLRQELHRKSLIVDKKHSLEDIFSKATQGDVKELNLILKADVHGSLEAIRGMIGKISTVEVKTKIIHSAVGGISESDVLLAQGSKALVIGFNVRPDSVAANRAKQLGIELRTYSIVYEMVDDLKKAMGGLLTPDIVEKVMGRAEVRNIFSVPKLGTIAGSFITDGKVQRSNQLRLIRDGKIIYDGKLVSLKRFKDDAKEVAQGFECGIGIENYNDIKVGDVIEAYVKEEVARELSAPIGPS